MYRRFQGDLWGRLTPPQSPWERLQVTFFDLCVHIVMVTKKCTDVFRGIFWFGGIFEGDGYRGGFFHEELLMGEETFNGGGAGFSSII